MLVIYQVLINSFAVIFDRCRCSNAVEVLVKFQSHTFFHRFPVVSRLCEIWRFCILPLGKLISSGTKWLPFRRRYYRNTFPLMKHSFSIIISLKLVPNGPIDDNPALVKKIAWRRIGDKSLVLPMLARITDAYTHHVAFARVPIFVAILLSEHFFLQFIWIFTKF